MFLFQPVLVSAKCSRSEGDGSWRLPAFGRAVASVDVQILPDDNASAIGPTNLCQVLLVGDLVARWADAAVIDDQKSRLRLVGNLRELSSGRVVLRTVLRPVRHVGRLEILGERLVDEDVAFPAVPDQLSTGTGVARDHHRSIRSL